MQRGREVDGSREREKVLYMCVCGRGRVCVFMSLLSYPVSLSRSPFDARTPNPTDRLRVISLSPLTHTQIFIRAQPSQCTVWHQQSCATRTGPCGDPRDLEKMSQIYFFPSPAAALLSHSKYIIIQKDLKKRKKEKKTAGTKETFVLHCQF